MEETLADFINSEAQRFTGFVYCSQPFSCGLTEATVYLKKYAVPSKERMTITRTTDSTTILVKPFKGRGRRKEMKIVLWQ